MSDEIICRCEEVTRSEIEAALAAGVTTANELKRFTRAGMGLCQGRTCRRLTERMLAEKTGVPLKDIEPATYRQPVRPVKAELLQNNVEETLRQELIALEKIEGENK